MFLGGDSYPSGFQQNSKCGVSQLERTATQFVATWVERM